MFFGVVLDLDLFLIWRGLFGAYQKFNKKTKKVNVFKKEKLDHDQVIFTEQMIVFYKKLEK